MTMVRRALITTDPGPRKAATISLLLWGLLHVLGGLSVMFSAADPATGLASLASAAPSGSIPTDPGPIVVAVLGFHGFNLAMAGIAVTLITLKRTWRRWPEGVAIGLVVAGVADAGLIIFLLAPGHMPLAEGLWGPALLAVALVAVMVPSRSAAESKTASVAVT